MSVYVDNAYIPFGRMMMCHMWADSREELFAMADRIGMKRRWFQRPPCAGGPGMDASWEHFDISVGKRIAALRLGAIETDRFGPMEHLARLDVESGEPARVARGQRRLADIAKSRAMRAADLPAKSAGRPARLGGQNRDTDKNLPEAASGRGKAAG